MNAWTKLFMPALATLLIGGCAAPVIRSDVTTFQEWPGNLQRASYAFERTREQENDLEYRHYENLVRGELNRLGFVESADSQAPKLRAWLTYGVKVRDVNVSEPVVVDPYPYYYPYPYPYWRGYYSPFYDPLWYGPPVVARRVANYQVFRRDLKTGLNDAASGKKLWETTVVNEGTGGSMALVMPYLVRSAFQVFPGQNGVTRRVELNLPQ